MLTDEAEHWRRLDILFAELLDLPPGDRGAFLERQCDDAGLRDALVSLLRMHDALGDFLGARPAWFDEVLHSAALSRPAGRLRPPPGADESLPNR